MNSNQQVSNFIYYYPKVLDSQICNSILTHYNKDTFKGWKTSTFSTTK